MTGRNTSSGRFSVFTPCFLLHASFHQFDEVADGLHPFHLLVRDRDLQHVFQFHRHLHHRQRISIQFIHSCRRGHVLTETAPLQYLFHQLFGIHRALLLKDFGSCVRGWRACLPCNFRSYHAGNLCRRLPPHPATPGITSDPDNVPSPRVPTGCACALPSCRTVAAVCFSPRSRRVPSSIRSLYSPALAPPAAARPVPACSMSAAPADRACSPRARLT